MSASPGARATGSVIRGAYGISQFMEGTGANLRLPAQPAVLLRVGRQLRPHDRRRHDRAPASRSSCPGTTPIRQRAGLRSGPPPAVHAAVERVRRVPADGERCRPRSATSATMRTTWSRPSRATRRCPASATPRPGRPRTRAARSSRRSRSSRPSPPPPRARAASTTRCRRASGSARGTALEFLASYTLAKGTTNNRGFYGVFGGTGPQGVTSATEGAYWQNTYDPEAEWGPMFHDVRHNFIFSATYELPFGKGRKWGSDWCGVTNALLGGWKLGGIFQARTGLPITVIDGRARSLQGERGAERPNCVGDPVPSDQSITHVAGHQRLPGRPARHLRQLPGRRRTGARATATSTSCSPRASTWEGTGTSSSASRPST